MDTFGVSSRRSCFWAPVPAVIRWWTAQRNALTRVMFCTTAPPPPPFPSKYERSSQSYEKLQIQTGGKAVWSPPPPSTRRSVRRRSRCLAQSWVNCRFWLSACRLFVLTDLCHFLRFPPFQHKPPKTPGNLYLSFSPFSRQRIFSSNCFSVKSLKNFIRQREKAKLLTSSCTLRLEVKLCAVPSQLRRSNVRARKWAAAGGARAPLRPPRVQWGSGVLRCHTQGWQRGRREESLGSD